MATDGADEDVLLRSILQALPFALEGAGSESLSFRGDGALVLPAAVSASLATALAPVGEPCVLYRAIDAALRRPMPRGLLLQALYGGIRDSLRAYLHLIGEIEQQLQAFDVRATLAAVTAVLQAPTLYLRLFRTIIEETRRAPASALDVVYKYTQHGDPLVRAHAAELHARMMEPYSTLLEQWQSRGSLQSDVFGELFVEFAEPHDFVFVEARVPQSMALAEARRIFERGKALYFIRVVCGREDYDGTGRADADIREYTHELLLHDNELLLHFRGLRDYMLLANGNFVDALFRNDSANFLMQPLHAVSQYLASEFFIGTIDDLGAEKLEDRRVLRCVDAYILGLNTAAEDRLVWEAFVGKYQLDSAPLRMVVDADATKKYQRAFAVLWRVRLAVYSLTDSSLRLRQLGALGAASARAQHLVEVHMVMNKTFLRLQEHLYYTVIGQQWALLERALVSAKQLTLHDVKAAHAAYLDAIAAVVSLPDNVQAVQTMTRLALGLQRVLEDQELEMMEGERAAPDAEDELQPELIELADAFESVAAALVLPA